MRRRTLLQASASLGASLLLPATGFATALRSAGLPDRVYRFIVGAPPGGATDLLARLLARHLSTLTGRTFVVGNQPGANGLVAAHTVAHQHAHEVLILLGTTSHLLVNQLTQPRLPLNLRTDLARLYLLCTGSTYLTVNPQRLPVRSLPELLQHLQQHKGLSLGSLGPGSYPHLLGKRLNQITDGQMLHVPYKGEAPMVYALLSGELDMGWVSAKHLQAHPKRLLPLAGHSPQRLSKLPEVPTFAEAGLPDAAMARRGWIGAAVSVQLPAPIQQALARAIATVAASASMKQGSSDLGMTLVQNSSPESFERFYQSEYQQWARLVHALLPLNEL